MSFVANTSGIPPLIAGSSLYKTAQIDKVKITEVVGAAVSEFSGYKGSIKAATTANITLTAAQTVDGVALVAGDLALVKNQTTGSENGIYIVSNSAWVRSLLLPTGSDAAGIAVYVTQGTSNGDKIFTCINNIGSGIVGTDSLTFTALVTSPAGSTTQVQFNDSGIMAGDSGLVYNKISGLLTAVGGYTATTGDLTASSGSLAISTAAKSINLTKGTGTAATLSGTATIVARQGIITVTSGALAVDVAASMTITATGMVTASNLILVGVNSMTSSAGGPVVAVTARTPPNTFVITTTNCSSTTPMAASAITIGYVIM